jgi:hypothetical protein
VKALLKATSLIINEHEGRISPVSTTLAAASTVRRSGLDSYRSGPSRESPNTPLQTRRLPRVQRCCEGTVVLSVQGVLRQGCAAMVGVCN